jgi:hypothetical protein
MDGLNVNGALRHERRCGSEALSDSRRLVLCMRALRTRGSEASHAGQAVPLPQVREWSVPISHDLA